MFKVLTRYAQPSSPALSQITSMYAFYWSLRHSLLSICHLARTVHNPVQARLKKTVNFRCSDNFMRVCCPAEVMLTNPYHTSLPVL